MRRHVVCALLFPVMLCAQASAQTVEPDNTVAVRSLIMTFNPDDADDSEFLRHLLLTHGLSLDIGHQRVLGAETYQRLLDAISSNQVEAMLNVKDVRDEFTLSLLKGTVAAGSQTTVLTKPQRVDHRLLWWNNTSPKRDTPDISPALPSPSSSSAAVSLHKKQAEKLEPPMVRSRPKSLPDQTGKPTVPSKTTAPHAPRMQAPAMQSSRETIPTDQTLPLVTFNDDVPAGFEGLSGPQFMFVDLYFNDEAIGSVGITLTDDTIVFEQPDEVALLLAEKVNDKQLLEWLSQELKANGHLACYAENDPAGCGQITADPLAIIYNAVSLRLDLFVESTSQQSFQDSQARYLATPVTKGAAIFSLYGVASDFSSGQTRVDVSGNAILSQGRTNLIANLQYNDEADRTAIDTLTLTHHLNNYDVKLGTFGFSAGGALSELSLIGAGFSTSFKSRIDLERAFSSQMLIYLPRRSVVQLLVDERIYAGASYAAGNQTLDTTALPDGTYEVEIVIQDPVEGSRRERRLFTKSAQIPPADEWVVSATAGALRNANRSTLIPRASDLPVIGANASRRLTDQSAYRLGILQFDDMSIAHGEFLFIGKQASFNGAMSIGEHKLRAASIQAVLRTNGQQWGLSASHFSTSLNLTEDAPAADFLVSNNTRIDLSFHRALPWVTLGARIGIREEQTTDANREASTLTSNTYSIFAQRPVWRSRHRRGILGFRYQHDSNESLAQLSMNVYFGSGAWKATTGLSLTSSDIHDSQWQTRAGAGWHANDLAIGAVATEAYVTAASEENTFGFSTDLRHSRFRANLTSDQANYADRENSRNSILSFSAYAGIDEFGHGMGGSDYSQSGLIVDITGEPAGERVDVIINNAVVDNISIGKPQFIGLQPFNQYEVKLRPQTLLSNGIDGTTHTLTLFPGNIGRVSVTARRQVLLIALVVDDAESPVHNAAVTTGSNTLIIDDSGLLQAEVYDGQILDVRRSDGTKCTIAIDIDTTDDVLTPEQPLLCTAR